MHHQIALSCGTPILVDDEYVELVLASTFRLCRTSASNSYVKRGGRHREAYLHRMVMGAMSGQIVDHRNGDTLDNRRCNLRLVDGRENAWNQAKKRPGMTASRFKGVSIDRKNSLRPWRALIRPREGVRVCIGSFSTEVEAAFFYDMKSIEEHGEFGRRNFLPLVR